MIKKFGKYQVDVKAHARCSNERIVNRKLSYGDKVSYIDNFRNIILGWYIGDSPSGLTSYIISVENKLVACKYMLELLDWESCLTQMSTCSQFSEAVVRVEESRPDV